MHQIEYVKGGQSMKQELIPALQMFIIPASILFVAIGVAKTEALKTLLSLMACGVGVIWFVRVYRWAGGLSFGDKFTALGLAIICLMAAVICLVAHGMLWWSEYKNRGLINAFKSST
jgi:hypothetical protein